MGQPTHTPPPSSTTSEFRLRPSPFANGFHDHEDEFDHIPLNSGKLENLKGDGYTRVPLQTSYGAGFNTSILVEGKVDHSDGEDDDDPDHEEKGFWSRMMGRWRRKGRRKVGVRESVRAFVSSSWLNLLVVFVPITWVAHFLKWPDVVVFSLAVLSIIPLQSLIDFGGAQLYLYCGKRLADVILVTSKNAVEATIAFVLLVKCELRLLQSTIVGVLLLHLLFIPRVTFLQSTPKVGKEKGREATRQPQPTTQSLRMNHVWLNYGIMFLYLPVAWLAAIDRGLISIVDLGSKEEETLKHFSLMSRIASVVLIETYLCVCFKPTLFQSREIIMEYEEERHKHEQYLNAVEPVVNPFACLGIMASVAGVLTCVAFFMIDSIGFVSLTAGSGIRPEFFGLILLPLTSYIVPGLSGLFSLAKKIFRWVFGNTKPDNSGQDVVRGISADLCVQFLLFWMPLMVELGWVLHKPMSLLFDFFEVALLLATCFLVNYVATDTSTDWLKELCLLSFYFMIAICAWFYPGQPEVVRLLSCDAVPRSQIQVVGSLGHFKVQSF